VGQGEERVSSLILWGDGPDKGFLEQPRLNHLTFWVKCGIKKGKSKGGKTMREKVLGCDVSKDYIILHDGSQAYKLSLENFKSLQKLVNNSIVVME
jgi:hypothetical protein